MIFVSLTTDFECLSPSTAGDSFIDIKKQMIEPAKKLVKFADKYGFKITFFLEIIQWNRFHYVKEYRKDIKKLNNFLKDLYSDGHDIQIHAHSEWVTAKRNKNKWIRAWTGKDNVHEIMSKFLQVFDNSLKRLKATLPKEYNMTCFRAGGYAVDPVDLLFPQLKKRGFLADSSRHNKNLFGLKTEKNLISMPILGTFPTTNQRWDMNLSYNSPFYIFKRKTSCYENNIKFAVMMGHTKQIHFWDSINTLFSFLKNDRLITAVTISEQINLIKALYKAELNAKGF